MAVIKLSDIQLVFDGTTLTISSLKSPEKTVSLDANSVEELVDFVHGLAANVESEDQGPNRRESFRVPVMEASGLSVRLVKRGTSVDGKPLNISMTGVFVKVPVKSEPDFELGDEVVAEISYQKSKLQLGAIVRRKENRGMGLLFPETIRDEHVNPPPLIRHIVMELQRRWMQGSSLD